jgi:hypothetical protein
MNINKNIFGRAAISCQEKPSSKNGDSFFNITRLRLIFSPWLRHISLSLPLPFSLSYQFHSSSQQPLDKKESCAFIHV